MAFYRSVRQHRAIRFDRAQGVGDLSVSEHSIPLSLPESICKGGLSQELLSPLSNWLCAFGRAVLARDEKPDDIHTRWPDALAWGCGILCGESRNVELVAFYRQA